ncbi:hypothetical protein GUJ93_ZPchr0006g44623 [Zizania palustris]|uniref:Uncharacterized protein n=1 Tax=Zizania palustris TaxID=103762 RepID=A0A8J5VNT2_ZIZPA|nr:hypothetical protein GUJ93_ZPchr0006g44623 [Zizania palustris]
MLTSRPRRCELVPFPVQFGIRSVPRCPLILPERSRLLASPPQRDQGWGATTLPTLAVGAPAPSPSPAIDSTWPSSDAIALTCGGAKATPPHRQIIASAREHITMG